MKSLKTTIAIGLLASMAGCQSTSKPETLETVTNVEQVRAIGYYEAIKADQVKWADVIANVADLKLYSSTAYSELVGAWEDTVEVFEEMEADPTITTDSYSIFSSGSYADKHRELLAEVVKWHTALTELKQTADRELKDSREQIEYLATIEAARMFPSDYKSIYDAYKGLFEYIADNDLPKAQETQIKFLAKAKTLEENVVLKKYISPLKSRLSEQRTSRLHTVAPISYAKAKGELAKSEQIVKANTRDLEIITKAVSDTEFKLDHVVSVANEVRYLSKVKNGKFESVVLRYEAKILLLSKLLSDADYRDVALMDQIGKIIEDVEQQHADADSLKSEGSIELAKLMASNEDLKSKLSKAMTKSVSDDADNSALKAQLTREQEHSEQLAQLLKSFQTAQPIAANEAQKEPVKVSVLEEVEAKDKTSVQAEAPVQVEAKSPTKAAKLAKPVTQD